MAVREFEVEYNTQSLIDTLMGVNPSEENSYTLQVEFWQSPINYRGYKKSLQKLVIYGIKDVENVHFMSNNDNLIMISNDRKYLLRNSSSFTKLEPILN